MLLALHPVSDLVIIWLLALLLNIGVGAWLPPRFQVFHPLYWLEKLTIRVEEKLNREKRNERTRFNRGMLFTLLITIAALIAGYWLSRALGRIYPGLYFEIILVAVFLGAGPQLNLTWIAWKRIKNNPAALGELPLGLIRREQLSGPDKHAIIREILEALCVRFYESLIAPLLGYILLGLPGLIAISAVKTLDNCIGYRSSQLASFGRAAAGLDDLLQWIPARLAGIIIMLAAAFSPGANIITAARILQRDAQKLVSRNAGWPIAAMAGALNITLGGPRSLHQSYIDDKWVGEGTVKLEFPDFKRGILLYCIALLLLAFSLLVIFALLP